MDIHVANNTNGVDRHIRTLINGLRSRSDVKIFWIHLVNDDQMLYQKEEVFTHYIKLSIPIPLKTNDMYSEQYWMNRYNGLVFKFIEPYLDESKKWIIHLHTLNLIDLAVYMQKRINCKIITHLHCLPWKSFFNFDQRVFNKLYKICYQDPQHPDFSSPDLCRNRFELDSYNKANHVICVTQCAEQFLSCKMPDYSDKVSVIPNGIDDLADPDLFPKKYSEKKTSFECLYVGVVSESKGLKFILKALNRVKDMGYDTTLYVAGTCLPGQEQRFRSQFPNLKLKFLGCIPFEELKMLYQKCDVGLIASLQEQASYVAVEMAMFGLPVVTTAVDGLDELFTDEVNALKVNTLFSPVLGLSVDVDMMANQIVRLINEPNLAASLSKNVRQLYESSLKLDTMIERIVDVYKHLDSTEKKKYSIN